MTTRALLGELEGRGVALKVTPQGNIRCTPKSVLTPKDIARLREHKQDLVKLLESEKSENQSIQPSPSSPPSPCGQKAHTYGESTGDGYGDGCGDTETTVTTLVRAAEQRSSALGLVARWSYEFGFTSIHDPTTGEWHDVPTADAPDWARWEVRKRKELYKSGNHKAYRLTAREMEEVWGSEHKLEILEGIVEEYPVEEE